MNSLLSSAKRQEVSSEVTQVAYRLVYSPAPISLAFAYQFIDTPDWRFLVAGSLDRRFLVCGSSIAQVMDQHKEVVMPINEIASAQSIQRAVIEKLTSLSLEKQQQVLAFAEKLVLAEGKPSKFRALFEEAARDVPPESWDEIPVASR